MKYFPINMDIRGRKVLVVGGGNVAFRKTETLLKCGGLVTVVSPEFAPAFDRLSGIRIIRRRYRKSDIRGAFLVISATDSTDANRRVWEHATAAHVPVNVVDQPDLCTFTVPSVIARDELILTISTGGGSPALAKQIRKHLESQIGPSYGKHLALLKEFRSRVKSSQTLNEKSRSRLLKQASAEEVRNTLETKGVRAARLLLQQLFEDATNSAE